MTKHRPEQRAALYNTHFDTRARRARGAVERRDRARGARRAPGESDKRSPRLAGAERPADAVRQHANTDPSQPGACPSPRGSDSVFGVLPQRKRLFSCRLPVPHRPPSSRRGGVVVCANRAMCWCVRVCVCVCVCVVCVCVCVVCVLSARTPLPIVAQTLPSSRASVEAGTRASQL